MERKELALDEEKVVSYVGPDAAQGPMPALIYFALSEVESLLINPYNQPVQFLFDKRIRIFSFTIPCHGPDLDPREAIGKWAEHFAKGEDILTPFIQSVAKSIEEIRALGLIEGDKIAVAGLSRGAFIAAHVAACLPNIPRILGFAPLTQLNMTNEFVNLQENSLAQSLNLENIAEKICERKVRFYIGNRDMRVGTDRAFAFIQKLADLAFEKRIRASSIEMIIGTSIGYMGHGTAPHVFQAGVDWLCEELQC